MSLVRYTLGNTDELVAYPDLVNERFQIWLNQQQTTGTNFTEDQLAYLDLIKARIASSLSINLTDLQSPPFSAHGGLGKARQLFGSDLNSLLNDLTEALAA